LREPLSSLRRAEDVRGLPYPFFLRTEGVFGRRRSFLCLDRFMALLPGTSNRPRDDRASTRFEKLAERRTEDETEAVRPTVPPAGLGPRLPHRWTGSPSRPGAPSRSVPPVRSVRPGIGDPRDLGCRLAPTAGDLGAHLHRASAHRRARRPPSRNGSARSRPKLPGPDPRHDPRTRVARDLGALEAAQRVGPAVVAASRPTRGTGVRERLDSGGHLLAGAGREPDGLPCEVRSRAFSQRSIGSDRHGARSRWGGSPAGGPGDLRSLPGP